MSDLLVARSSGRVMVRDGDGKPRYYSVARGVTVARVGHPIVEADPKMWQPLRVHYDLPARNSDRRPVEQATAAPGEVRTPAPAQEHPAEYACDECPATAKSPAGLAAHKRSHRSNDE